MYSKKHQIIRQLKTTIYHIKTGNKFFALKTWQIGVMCTIAPPNLCSFDNFLFYQRQFPKDEKMTLKTESLVLRHATYL